MNAQQVLQRTFSIDAVERSDGEQRLAHAAATNFADYLTSLVKELDREDNPPHIRAAAGIALKNAFTFRDQAKLREAQRRWAVEIPAETKAQVKESALKTLHTSDRRARSCAALVIVSIAAIELPRSEWPELMQTLVQNVASGTDALKHSSLTTIGFICESQDVDLRASLPTHYQAILTAVLQGARREELNTEVRCAAIAALGDTVDFMRPSIDNEGERNYIMHIVSEATLTEDTRIQTGAFGCLSRIMGAFYDRMPFCMENGLLDLSIVGMKNRNDDVAKLAIEFWSTVCEEEITIGNDNTVAYHEGLEPRQLAGFARNATRKAVPVLLEAMCRQNEEIGGDEYDVSHAAYQALQLYAQCVRDDIVLPVVTFVGENCRNEDWRRRDAAVAAFGAIMEGPEPSVLEPLIKQALSLPTGLLGMMNDSALQVRDSAAYALGRVCDSCPEALDPDLHLQPLIAGLLNGISSDPRMVDSCCWALINVVDRFSGDAGSGTNPLSKHFKDSVRTLLAVTEPPHADGLRTASYEVLISLVLNSATENLAEVSALLDVIIQRLEQTIPLQQQAVNTENRGLLEGRQTSLISVILAIVQCLGIKITPQADRIMYVLLQVLSTHQIQSGISDVAFTTIGAVASALKEGFGGYIVPLEPFMVNAFHHSTDPSFCSITIDLISDVVCALNETVRPLCHNFLKVLVDVLPNSPKQLIPVILQTFGDIAQAMGSTFKTHLPVVGRELQGFTSMVTKPQLPLEMGEHIIAIRTGILDAWDGIILSYKGDSDVDQLHPFIESIFQLLHIVSQGSNREEGLMRSSMSVISNLAEAFPKGELAACFRNLWITILIREICTARQYSQQTIDIARSSRVQVKHQINMSADAA
ncbi:hypothetical protein PENANT_c056G05751 [Penicillium antarcticum]|uniref:Importin-95 n=1 Tax=Penicillium antarcticum TaxID=416450 RepID=A0A1V6PQI5_9EURO|nr:uncharacterized protein N7508_011151 [Penicillium antarcticum]KAJ5288376.1 hypothetical protein N7508_011151 [Penicillium antarcticum]OQD79245.1 hypothetical protein PENANT_c056G05751 [Penicillium antarcticum]